MTKTLSFKERGGKPGGGKGFLGSWELAFTLSTNQDQYVMHELEQERESYSFSPSHIQEDSDRPDSLNRQEH